MNKVKIPHSLNLLPKKLDLTVNFSVFDSDNFFVNFILFNTLGIFSTTVLVLVHSVFFSTTVLVHVHWRRLLLLSVCCFHIMYFTLKLDLLFQNEGIKSCWQKYHTCNCIKWRISLFGVFQIINLYVLLLFFFLFLGSTVYTPPPYLCTPQILRSWNDVRCVVLSCQLLILIYWLGNWLLATGSYLYWHPRLMCDD